MVEKDLLDEDSSVDFLPAMVAPDRERKPVKHRNVLVIEDDIADYKFVARCLKKARGVDFRLTHAASLSEGLDRLAKGGIDVVLLDLGLPDSRGLETFQKIRSHAPVVPIIVLSGLDDESLAVEAAREGAQDYLVKGKFDTDLLLRSISYARARNKNRAKLQRALQRTHTSEANLTNVITSNVDGMVVVDSRGTVRFSNPAAEALFGRSADELPVTRCGFPMTAGTLTETSIVRSDGQHVPVEVRVAEMSWEGRPAYLIVLRDLTSQKRAEAERAQLAAIAQSTEDAIVSADLDGTLLSWNQGAEKMFGYSAEEVHGRRISILAPPEDRDMVLGIVEQVKRGETVSQVESTHALRDGRRLDISLSAFPICNAQGELVSIGGIIRDITERRRAQRAQETLRERQVQLEAAQEIQKRLLPQTPPTLPDFDIAGALSPAELAAGDYFDYLPMIDGSVAIAVGDVSGHGFGPALLMAATSAHLRSLVQVSDNVQEILGLLNQALAARTADEHFVTFLLARLDYQSHSLSYSSAGHPDGYVLDVSGDLKARLESTGLPLAITPDAEFPMGISVKLDPGDTVIMLSDGFIEASSPAGKQFRTERVLDVVRANRSKTAEGIIQSLYQAVQEFSGQKTQSDDLTAIVIKLMS